MKAFLDGKGLCQKCEGWWWLTDNLSNQLPGNIKVLAVMQTNSLEGNFCVTNHPAGLVHWQFSNYKPCKASPYLEIYHLWLQHVIFMVLSSSSAILFIDKTDWFPVQMKWLSKNKEVKIKNKLTGGSCVLTFEMKGMCILVYGLMSLISTWVLMFLRSSATQRHMISLEKKKKRPSVDWSHVRHSPSMCSLMKGSSIMLLWFVFKIFSNSVMSLFWYALEGKTVSVVLIYTLCLCDQNINSHPDSCLTHFKILDFF